MFGKKKIVSMILVGFVFLCVGPTSFVSAGPLDFFGGGKTVEAEPGKEYRVKDTNGPWMIFVTAFSGPTAKADADALVFELRKKYKYNAYIFEKTFVHDLQTEGRQNPYAVKKTNYKSKGKVDNFVVLIGDFQSLEDPDFQKTCKEIKQCNPECMKKKPAGAAVSTMQGNSGKTPFSMAFGVTNPVLPPEFYSQKGTVDKFIEQLNSDSPFSLLNCPGRYTVRVATFTGKIEIKQDKINQILEGKAAFSNGPSELELGGKAATKLCRALRKEGFEAYEFHDRYASFVTIGSFHSVGQELPNGMTELPPEIAKIMNLFRGKPVQRGASSAKGAPQTVSHEPVRFDNIECDIQPVIIEVPRRQR